MTRGITTQVCAATLFALLAAGCEKESRRVEEVTAPPTQAPPPRLAFGACAAATRRFDSGPRAVAEPVDSGWGTIGTGRYGTIGHGSGTGSGYGYGAGRGGMRSRMVVPEVHLGTATISGTMDKAVLRRYVRRNLPKIRYCYEKALLTSPGLQGTVTVDFTIDAQGGVSAVKATGVAPQVSSCVGDVIKTIVFPAAKDGNQVQVIYPLRFSGPPAGATDPAAAEPVTPELPQDNPLQGQQSAIQECLQQAGQPHGALVVDLQVAGGGTLTASRTHGVNAATGACITKAAGAATWRAAAVGAYRCSLAFGTLTADAAPGIDVTAAAILLGKDQVAAVPELVADETPERRIPALRDRLAAAEEQLARAPEAVAITGPLVLRVADDVPMKIVQRLLDTVADAGAGGVLAARRAAGWAFLRAIELPVAPVPRGSGSPWSDTVDKREPVEVSGEERVIASILITPDALWVGLSRVNELVKIEATAAGHDWTQLDQILAEHKKGLYLKDRTDIEIGGDDTVRFGDAVKAIDAATRAGFTDWKLAAPHALTVKFRE